LIDIYIYPSEVISVPSVGALSDAELKCCTNMRSTMSLESIGNDMGNMAGLLKEWNSVQKNLYNENSSQLNQMLY